MHHHALLQAGPEAYCVGAGGLLMLSKVFAIALLAGVLGCVPVEQGGGAVIRCSARQPRNRSPRP